MDYSAIYDSAENLATDCLILGFHPKRKLSPAASVFDEQLEGLLTKLLKRDDIEGKPGDVLCIQHLAHEKIQRVILVGLGKDPDASAYRKALAAAIKALKESGAKNAISTLHQIAVKEADLTWKIRQSVETFEAALYRFNRLKTDKKDKPQRLSQCQFLTHSNDESILADISIKQGLAIAHGMNLAKDMANLPGNICTPRYMAEQAEKIGKAHKKLKVKILNEDELEELGMGSFLSVSRGSRQPAKFIIMEYMGAKDQKPIVLVGKGLTFDAGGISLKPSQGMDEMKYDMCGGASVIAALSVAAELELNLHVVGLVPATENLPDGDANKPGDIVTSMSGLTIEILNTDAEGRLILCDTLTYAKRYGPRCVIDVATLTGACVVALGKHNSGIMSNNDELCNDLIKAGETSCDRIWRLPMGEEYQEQLKSNFADVANIGGPDGGAITAACFLSRFAKDFDWAHIDIAGTAWKSGAEKGATGRPVPLLSQYLIDQAS